MRGLNLDQVRAFVEVVARGSFSAAAERLALTQPAVSLKVRQLESYLGVRLIERVGRTARPTAAGAAFLAHARRIEGAVSDAQAEMARHAGGALGRVRIGTGATAAISLLPDVLKGLRHAFPTLELTVATGNTSDIVKAVEDNLMDIGLVTLPAAGRMLEVTPVLDDEFVVLAPRAMALPAQVDAPCLVDKPVILFEPGGNTRRIADDWFARGSVAIRPVMSLGSVEAIKALVGAGLGCAVLPGMAVRQARPVRTRIHPLAPRLSRTLALVLRRDKPMTRGLKAVADALMEAGRAFPPRAGAPPEGRSTGAA